MCLKKNTYTDHETQQLFEQTVYANMLFFSRLSNLLYYARQLFDFSRTRLAREGSAKLGNYPERPSSAQQGDTVPLERGMNEYFVQGNLYSASVRDRRTFDRAVSLQSRLISFSIRSNLVYRTRFKVVTGERFSDCEVVL